MFGRKKESFYYPGVEIPVRSMDRYRCLDAVTIGALQKARRRISFLIAFFAVCFLIILGRLFFLTIVNYQERDFKPSVLRADFEMERKNILDRNGVLLATGVPTVDLSVNPKKVKNPEEVARRISAVLPDVNYQDVYDKLTSNGSFKYIKRNLTPAEQYEINKLGYYFLTFTKGEKRIYPQGHLFAHVIGTVNIDNVGTSGLEKQLNETLMQTDVQLSLDLTVQQIVHSYLSEGIQKYQATGGGALVMDVQTGEILAMVSLPDYNPNILSTMTKDNSFNKTTLGVYEFGSVFKLFNTAMALENQDIEPWDSFDASEPYKIGRKSIEDYRGQNRVLSVPEILMHSSNIGSVHIALKSGAQKQKEFLNRFGFFDQLPIDFPERGTPLYIKGKWPDITVANVAFGYSVSVTPLHLAAAVSSLVNGGLYHTPVFIKAEHKPEIEYRVLSERTSNIMRALMWAVINWEIPEGKPLLDYAIGGKTGSANLLDENGKYVKRALRTTVAAAFPMNEPRYVVVAFLENPKGIKETWNFNTAGWNTKPIVLDMIIQMASYLGVPAQNEMELPSYVKRAIETSLTYKKQKD